MDNGRVADYCEQRASRAPQCLKPLLSVTEVHVRLGSIRVSVTAEGSSPTTMRRAEAVTHTIASALMNCNLRLRLLLRQAGFGLVRLEASKAQRSGNR